MFGKKKENVFKHELGAEVVSKSTKLKGICTARSENLYGCNRYFVQPPVDKASKFVDGYWIDEDDVEVIGDGITAPAKNTGGPVSTLC